MAQPYPGPNNDTPSFLSSVANAEPVRDPVRLLYAISRALHPLQDSARGVLKTSLSLIQQALAVDRGCIVAFDSEGAIRHAYLSRAAKAGDVPKDLWSWLIGLAQRQQRLIVMSSLSSRMPQKGERYRGSALAIPLIVNGDVRGAVAVIHPDDAHFSRADAEVFEAIAEPVGTALANAERFEELAASEARYHRLYNDGAYAVLITDLNGQIVDANRKAYQLFEYDANRLIGLPLTAVFRMGTGVLSGVDLHAAEPGREVEFTTFAHSQREAKISVRVRACRVRSMPGHGSDDSDFIAWTAHDVTSQVQLEQLRRDMAAMTYHDLRGPLHNINGSLSRLDKIIQGEQNPAVYELMNLATRSTRQLTQLVKSLLDVERLESGLATLERKPAQLTALLAEAAEVTYIVAADAGQQLDFDVAEDLPPLQIDADMILRVVTNLVDNAIKYTPTGGRVTVRAYAIDTGVRISVSDTGPGIPAAMQATIFDKYVRLKDRGNASGIGLGLAFCRLAIEAHGGTIAVESDPDRAPGTTFTITLPA